MDLKKIKSIIKFVSESNISEISIKIGNIKIYIKNKQFLIKKNDKNLCNYPKKSSFISDIPDRFSNKKEKESKNNNVQYLTIKSPMIGTFYRKPHPDQEPFVKIGDKIKIGTKVCVIETMKLFNDIESEINGKLIKILVEDSTPVDYDQPLFLLDPNY
ncbi:acetyl-CoA carboxylase biotin carboxyl carrier protein [Blattabacterium cuenoti]|uniref:acetyl-CoA carboxylase biotin carboxyl carrier protein n=1 Tax=Blattabacterium cuenoti TaxID=1653831 RepID=UPI00163D1A65|nr:acetyl-CoA carboxylase biotin carboxyl carrier protein [Blattabacterium cuenoti]